MMNGQIFRCCKKTPKFSITYTVNGSEKEYLVCSDCINLECFSKYIVSKTPISNSMDWKKIDGEFFDENVENEIINEKFGETVEQSENLAEQNEEKPVQFGSKNKRGAIL